MPAAGSDDTRAIVALWEPDLTPPDQWLLPSILYQDKISTLTPWPYADDRDSRKARELRDVLGPLYEPLALTGAFADRYQPELLELLRGRLPAWHSRVDRLARRTDNPYLRRWLQRSRGWPDRPRRMREVLQEELAVETAVRGRTDQLLQALRECDEQIATREAELAALHDTLSPIVDLERRSIGAHLTEALSRRAALVHAGRGWGRDVEHDQAIRQVDNEIRHLARQPPSVARQRIADCRNELLAAQTRRRGCVRDLHVAQQMLRKHRNTVQRVRSYIQTPWLDDDVLDPWLRPSMIDSELPDGLETIGFGKVYGQLFEFLATDAGMWVSQRPGSHSGTLVGPTLVVRDVLGILAEWHCSHTDGFVLMSGERTLHQHLDQEPETVEELVAMAMRWVLPVPDRGSLADALQFRLAHEEELRAVRDALASTLPELTAVDDLIDSVHLLRMSVAEPLAEIQRALNLHRSVSTRHMGQTIVYRSLAGMRNLAGGLAAAAVAAPVVGNTLGGNDLAATIGGGIVLSAAGMATQYAYRSIMRHSLHDKISNSPYRYIYEVGQHFPLPEFSR